MTTSEKHDLEVEYGLAPKPYGSTLEIDHIVSLELGGSNDIANLYPEKASPSPGFRVKDKLENKLHLVCAGQMGLRKVQRQDRLRLGGALQEGVRGRAEGATSGHR